MKRLVCAFLLVVCGGLASAHSRMDATLPADGAVLEDAPEKIVLRFDKSIRLVTIKMTHADQHTETLDIGDQTGFETEFTLQMTPLGAGRYDISWRGLGEDGHIMQGRFGFDVE